MKQFNKTNGMYALLIAVAAMIGVTFYGSCSADEDYDGYSSKDELFTLADGEMNLRTEGVNEQTATITYTNTILAFHPSNNSNDSSLFIYDSSDLTIRYNYNNSLHKVSIDRVECPLDDTRVFSARIKNCFWNPKVQSVTFEAEVKFERTINNTLYLAKFDSIETYQISIFHYN